MERAFQYNDSTYDPPADENSGIPVKIFESEEKADEECRRRCLRWLVGMDAQEITCYFPEYHDYDLDEIDSKLTKSCKNLFGDRMTKRHKWADPGIPEDATDVELEIIYRMIEKYIVPPFFVTEL